jgi:diketogulonate reductase-like aldo/keto reductase
MLARQRIIYRRILYQWSARPGKVRAGKLRAIGVSNFEEADLANILTNGTVKPMVNQILAHVGSTPFGLVDYSQSKDILVEAYSPVVHGVPLNNRSLATVAEKYGITMPQLCIRYCLQLDMLPPGEYPVS